MQSVIYQTWYLLCRFSRNLKLLHLLSAGDTYGISAVQFQDQSVLMHNPFFEEGVMIPPVRVIQAGNRNEEVFRIFTHNSRFPDLLEGDLNSLMAACQLGKKRVEECIKAHGTQAMLLAFETTILQTQRALEGQIKELIPEGKWAFRDRIDSDAVSERSYFVDAILQHKNSELTMDFTQTDKQADGPINFIMDESVPKFMLGLYLTRDMPGIIMNAGFVRALGK